VRGIQRSLALLSLWTLSLWAGGCGYQFAGSGTLPEGISRICVLEFGNRTAESQIATLFSNDLKNEFTRRQIDLVNASEEAQATVSGALTALSDETVSRRGQTTALERRLRMFLNASLKSAQGRTLWAANGITADEVYSVVDGDDSATTRNKQQALGLLSKRLAENVYNQMTVDF
jgi:outer membrane lipopolysaccharide assembly protein LptE/RlpB